MSTRSAAFTGATGCDPLRNTARTWLVRIALDNFAFIFLICKRFIYILERCHAFLELFLPHVVGKSRLKRILAAPVFGEPAAFSRGASCRSRSPVYTERSVSGCRRWRWTRRQYWRNRSPLKLRLHPDSRGETLHGVILHGHVGRVQHVAHHAKQRYLRTQRALRSGVL